MIQLDREHIIHKFLMRGCLVFKRKWNHTLSQGQLRPRVFGKQQQQVLFYPVEIIISSALYNNLIDPYIA